MRLASKIPERSWDLGREKSIRKKWDSKKIYRFKLQRAKRIFAIDTPPPYPSGKPWSVGAAAQYSQIDMIARTARMMGNMVLFPIGIDRNGLPVELYTEKTFGVDMHEMPREKFIELCSHALDDLEAYMLGIMKSMGMSGDFENYYRTDSERYRRLTQSTFIELWKKGLIYEATRPNNYCWSCRTTIADADVVYEELPAKLVYIRFSTDHHGSQITVATTRPELLCSCQALVVHPDDERYKSLHVQDAVIPIFGRKVKILPHPVVKSDFGTGIVMVCSYGDLVDVHLFRELGLREIIAVDEGGTMSENAGAYMGLSVEQARQKMIEDLIAGGLVEKIENINHRTPICERSDTPIEIIPMKEYYLKQTYLASTLKRIAKRAIFHPPEHRQLLIDWIDSLKTDWPISRRRYYATEVPVWYCENCGSPLVPPAGRYYRPWREAPPLKKCSECGGLKFRGDERTFDTWMDSSISPLFILNYDKSDHLLKRAYPIGIRPQGKDIVRTWLYYTFLRCYQLMGRIPFNHVWVGGMGLDEKGERMSKSRGNVVDPAPALQKFGADAFRFWSAQEVGQGYDFRYSEARIVGAGKFLTKVWNVARFVGSFPFPEQAKLKATDKWILAELSFLIRECLDGYREFNFFVPSTKVRDFVWNLFAPHYVEMVKPRAYGIGFSDSEKRAAWKTLHTCLKTILLLLAPITPFIMDEIWTRIYSRKSIHLEQFPKAQWSRPQARLTKEITDLNSKVWNQKKQVGISLRDKIAIEIPRSLHKMRKDLVAMHNLES